MTENVPKMKMFIETYVPVTNCNLRCHYCYITQRRLFDEKFHGFQYSPETVAKAVSLERLGGICHFNICGGGETLLPPAIIKYIRAILEQGHYVMIITNGTLSQRFDEITKFPEPLLKRLCFKFSYHYIELKSRNLIEPFFENIRKMRDVGCSFSLELTPSDEAIPLIDEIRHVAEENVGASCHVTVARDETSPLRDKPILTRLSRSDYMKTWGTFASDMFEYKMSVFGQKRKEFCYAGAWSGHLNLSSGMFKQCYKSFLAPQNIFEDTAQPIRKVPIGRKCAQPHCFNAHAFLTLGLIPELDSIPYSRIRNKITNDGREWLSAGMSQFLSQKLNENNEEYSQAQKILHGIRYSYLARLPGSYKKKIARGIKKRLR